MLTTYFRSGDSFASVFGDNWENVYMLPENQLYREIVPDPNEITPGYRISFPDFIKVNRELWDYDPAEYLMPEERNEIPDALLITIFRNSNDPQRRNNLEQFIKHYKNYNIMIVEDGEKPSFDSHVFIKNDKPFNRSFLFNIGLFQTSKKIVVFIDSDIIMPTNNLNYAIDICYSRGIVTPVCKFKEKDLFRKGTTIGGGILIASSAMIKSLGGWCEDIRGWGYEDNAINTKINRLKCKHSFILGEAVHLPHDLNLNRNDQFNRTILNRLENMKIDDLRKECIIDKLRYERRAIELRS